jgi:hypothetical protein
MANLFLDSFDHYASADITKKYTSGSGGTIVTGRNGNGMSGSADKGLAPGDNRFIGGCAVKNGTLGFNIFEVGTGGIGNSNTQFLLKSETDGALKLYRGNTTGTLLGTTAAGLIAINTWNYVEVNVLIDDSVGTAEVRLNNVTVLTFSGDTKQQAAAGWTIVRTAVAIIDDLYINDGTGTINNTFWGDTRIDCVFPDGNGAHSEWTRSTGANQYATIDEVTPNGDTDYNSTATVNAIDTVTVGDTPAPDNTIRSVQLNICADKTDAGTATLSPVARQDGVDFVYSAQAPTTAYAYLRQIYERAPDTSVWTATIFNAMQFGYKRIS